jgi:NAD(P)H-dependent FMN reductase
MALPHIITILGSTRQGRVGGGVAAWFGAIADARDDMTHELVDLRDVDLPFFDASMPPAMGFEPEDPTARAWAKTISAGDGYVFVTPEYNHGYPAVLKNAIDHIYRPWHRKPAAFVGYGGPGAGVRAVEQLRQVVVEVEMVPLRHQVSIARAYMALDDEGRPRDPWHADDAVRLLDDLVWWARSLKEARQADLAAMAPA